MSLQRRPLIYPLFPYTTLFRSPAAARVFQLSWPAPPCFHSLCRKQGSHVPPLPPGPVLRQALSAVPPLQPAARSEEHTSELQSHVNLVCRLLLEKKNYLSQVVG